MQRPIWDGQITFGLINIPVLLYSAEKRNELSFHQIDDRNKARIHYKRVNEKNGNVVPWQHIVKGYELKNGQYVLLEKKDFEAADMQRTHAIDLVGFVDAAEIDLVYYDKPYYLVPGKNGPKAYQLLRETLKQSKKVGIAKVVIKTREYLAALFPWDEALVLMTMRFGDEVVDYSKIPVSERAQTKSRVSEQELKMAKNLVETMSMDWKPKDFHDEYKKKLLDLIQKKAKAKGPLKLVTEKAPEPTQGKVIDMVALLQRSMTQVKGGSGSAHKRASPSTRKAKRA